MLTENQIKEFDKLIPEIKEPRYKTFVTDANFL